MQRKLALRHTVSSAVLANVKSWLIVSMFLFSPNQQRRTQRLGVKRPESNDSWCVQSCIEPNSRISVCPRFFQQGKEILKPQIQSIQECVKLDTIKSAEFQERRERSHSQRQRALLVRKTTLPRVNLDSLRTPCLYEKLLTTFVQKELSSICAVSQT